LQRRHARRAGGFAQHPGAWAETDTSSQGGTKAKLPPRSSAGATSGAAGSAHRQTALFSTGSGTTDVLEAIAEKNENGVFTPTESSLALSAGNADSASLQHPDTLTILPIGDRTETTKQFPADNLTAVRRF